MRSLLDNSLQTKNTCNCIITYIQMKYILNNVGKRLSVSRVLFFEEKKMRQKVTHVLCVSCTWPILDILFHMLWQLCLICNELCSRLKYSFTSFNFLGLPLQLRSEKERFTIATFSFKVKQWLKIMFYFLNMKMESRGKFDHKVSLTHSKSSPTCIS